MNAQNLIGIGPVERVMQGLLTPALRRCQAECVLCAWRDKAGKLLDEGRPRASPLAAIQAPHGQLEADLPPKAG